MPKHQSPLNIRRPKIERGFTLLELLVGMTVGLMVLGTVAALFVPSLSTYRNNDALGQIQENERFAIKTISNAVDQAGYIGCDSTNSTPVVNVTNMPAAVNWVSDFGAPVRIFSPGSNASNSIGGGVRKTDSGENVGDVLTLISSSTSTFIIADHDAAAETITFRGNLVSQLDNKVILINDCTNSVMFEVGAGVFNATPAPGTTTFSYSAADTNNCEAASPARVLFGSTGSGEPSCANNDRYSEYTLRPGGNATILLAQSFYIAPSGQRNTNALSPINNSLYVVQVNSVGGYSAPLELISGVDNFRARYGIQTSRGDIVYRTGSSFDGDVGVELDTPTDQPETFDNVVSVEISLLLGSVSNKGERRQPDPQSFEFPNSQGVLQDCGVVGSGTAFTSACPTYLRSNVNNVNLTQRYRRVVSRVFNLRNQIL